MYRECGGKLHAYHASARLFRRRCVGGIQCSTRGIFCTPIRVPVASWTTHEYLGTVLDVSSLGASAKEVPRSCPYQRTPTRSLCRAYAMRTQRQRIGPVGQSTALSLERDSMLGPVIWKGASRFRRCYVTSTTEAYCKSDQEMTTMSVRTLNLGLIFNPIQCTKVTVLCHQADVTIERRSINPNPRSRQHPR